MFSLNKAAPISSWKRVVNNLINVETWTL